MKYIVEIADKAYQVEIGPDGVLVDGQPMDADLRPNHDSHLWHLVLDGRSHTMTARRSEGRGEWVIEVDGQRHDALALDERMVAIRALAGTTAQSHGPVKMKAPMPGLVIKVEVEPQATVETGQGVVVVEAMKMENELKAIVAGTVTDVLVKAGQTVDKGETLLVIEPDV
jgi:pyruvate carboxylase subunit B